MPSPESPANRMMTRSRCWTCLVTVEGPPPRAAAGLRGTGDGVRPFSADRSRRAKLGLAAPYLRAVVDGRMRAFLSCRAALAPRQSASPGAGARSIVRFYDRTLLR